MTEMMDDLIAVNKFDSEDFSLTSGNVLNKTALDFLIQEDPYLREILEKISKQRECDALASQTSCEQRELYHILMGPGFLVMFLFALIGNCLNLFVYNSGQIRFYIAIRMLCTKLLMNTLMMIFLLPQALRVIALWEKGSPQDTLYWKFWPYQAYFINVFGFCAMWLTVLMTAECYIHVFFPSQSKAICTKQNVSRSYVLMAAAGMILALIYPLNRTVQFRKVCGSYLVTIHASESELLQTLERFHMIANLILAIIVPLSLLIFMTASIVWRLLIRNSEIGATSRFSAEKRCVTRITLITTVLQVITELPSVPVLVYAAIFGPQVVNQSNDLCTWQTISHFLGLCNASLSFFVYISFSTRFRHTMFRAQRLAHRCCPMLVMQPKESVIHGKTSSTFVSHTPFDRSFRRNYEKRSLVQPKNSSADYTNEHRNMTKIIMHECIRASK
uniref:G-protein coupled receptors family 1 profile domain-containing protein n=2 Tax=Acrobeloides nanus TaxID=290746 RepID=A0A914E2I0_9BILA